MNMLIKKSAGLILSCAILLFPLSGWSADTFKHPGMLSTSDDLARITAQVNQQSEPWFKGFQQLKLSLGWQPRAVDIVYRGRNSEHSENYPQLYRDIAIAYSHALYWKATGNEAYAQSAVAILNAWGGTLKEIRGSTDAALAAGIYGYELANTAEIMRDYPGWSASDFDTFKKMMETVFLPINLDFIARHNNTKIDHYWANWDLAQLSSIMAIGILLDRKDLYDRAVDYYKNGEGNGAIGKLVWKLYPEQGMGQIQESGRDQAHSLLDIALAGAICQMAWNQGDDLFGYDDNRLMKGAEYVAAYNLGKSVPYTTYTNSDVTQTQISESARGEVRAVWALIYNHYVVLKGLNSPNITEIATKIRPEGGPWSYGAYPGGFDQLGYGTLLFTLGEE
ncbi:cell wall anchor protein [Lonsdalea iberica]|uniref:Cell wall anchor protein n=2 Tax=Lonsdalea iberica TaxID=1082703 RepID=A0A1X3RZ44_9GAMM|nr:cell wall anchor protein [Lonsdalea iberica]